MAGTSKALTQGPRGRACSVLVSMGLLVVTGLGWAQGSEPTQSPAQNSTSNSTSNSGQTAGKQLPDSPGESKKKAQSGNPVEFVRHKTKHQLLRARDWESGWIAGEYIGRNRTVVTPTREEREVIYLDRKSVV